MWEERVEVGEEVGEEEAGEVRRLLREAGIREGPGGVLLCSCWEGDTFVARLCSRRPMLGLQALRTLLSSRRPLRLPSSSPSPPLRALFLESHSFTATGLPQPLLDRLTALISYLGGRFYRSFMPSTTVLLTDRPRPDSEKYLIALRRKRVPIVSPQWIEDMWSHLCLLPTHPYLIRPFQGLSFAPAADLSSSDAADLAHLIPLHGGQWSPAGPHLRTSHIVVGSAPATQARPGGLRDLRTVSAAWVRACAMDGGLLPENDPVVDARFRAYLCPGCPPDAAALARQSGGRLVEAPERASIVISPLQILPAEPGEASDSLVLPGGHSVPRSIPIVSPAWLEASAAAGQPLSPRKYPPDPPKPPPPPPSLLVGVSFRLEGFSQDETARLVAMIHSHGGRLLPSSSLMSADYGLVADGHSPVYPAERRVASTWLEAAAELQQAPDVNHFCCVPLALATPFDSMKDLEICITGFENPMERRLIEGCVRRLGATWSSALRRLETTHLICRTPSGDKWERVARRGWKAVPVSLEWLEASCRAGRPLEPSMYPVTSNATTMVTAPSGGGGMDAAQVGGGQGSMAAVMGGNVILSGCVIFLARSLTPQDVHRYSDLAMALGAEVMPAWDGAVTHVIHQGAPRCRQLPPAARHGGGGGGGGVQLVSPAWLLECRRTLSRLPEVDFPCTLNPRRNLGQLDLQPAAPPPAGGSAVKRKARVKREPEPWPKIKEEEAPAAVRGPSATKRLHLTMVSSYAPLPPPLKQPQDDDDDGYAAAAAAGGVEEAAAVRTQPTTTVLSQASAGEEGSLLEVDEEVQKELSGLMGAIRSFGAAVEAGPGNSSNNNAAAVPGPAGGPSVPASLGTQGRSYSSSPGTVLRRERSGSRGMLRRSELKVGAASLGGAASTVAGPLAAGEISDGSDEDDEDENHRVGGAGSAGGGVADQVADKGVIYLDERQLRKQRQVLEKATDNPRGDARMAGQQQRKRQRYLDSEGYSSLDLESGESERLAGDSSAAAGSGYDSDEGPTHFTLSKYDEEQKQELSSIVTRLGGLVDEEFQLNVTTHVVVPVPSRSLKYLMGAACGCWVLQHNYLTECARRGRFIPEEDFEWSVDALPVGAVQPEEKYILADAPRRMRLLRSRGGPPLMHATKCVFLGQPEAMITYRQLAQALGATVVYVGMQPDWNRLSTQTTHVFCASAYVLQAADIRVQQETKLAFHLAEWIVQVILRAKLPKKHEYPVKSKRATAK